MNIMTIMFSYIIPILLFVSSMNASITITNSGIRSIGRLDVGMIFLRGLVGYQPSRDPRQSRRSFDHDAHGIPRAMAITRNPRLASRATPDFVELVNEGKQEITVASRMIGCCEIVTIENIECEHIQLIGEVSPVESQGIKNVTLIWPTLYLHDRRGECAVAISVGDNGNEVEEIRRKIGFDTTVTEENPNILREYYDAVDVKKCQSPDQDTLDRCHPVNCQIKYNGKRNYFNRELQRCQSVPICIADTNKELPDVVYDAINNTCRNVETSVTEAEIQSLSGGAAEVAWRSESTPRIRNMLCHHGYNDKHTGLCICDEGWTSQPLGNLEPINEYIHMCNVLVLPFPGLGNSPIHILLIIIAAVLIVLIVLFYCITTILIEVLPSRIKIERSQQTVRLSGFGGSSKTLTSCCSTRPASRKTSINASNITYSKLSNHSLHSMKPRTE